jgi:H+-transporting ATPase
MGLFDFRMATLDFLCLSMEPGYDNVIAHKEPEKWNKPALFAIASVLALVAFISSLLLLWMCLDSNNAGSWFQAIGLGGLSYGQVTNVVYLKISVSDFLTLFSSRTGGEWFWAAAPAPVLLGAGGVALSISTALATWWPDSSIDGILVSGLGLHQPLLLSLWVWLYCVVWWFIQVCAGVCVCVTCISNVSSVYFS